MLRLKFFGTDGIRGVVGEGLTEDLAYRVGAAAGNFFGGVCVLGRDTRLSGEIVQAAFASGVASAGCDVLLAGVLPTPAVSVLMKQVGAAFGAVISASHNPPEYNGIKLFSSGGVKLCGAEEEGIERIIDAELFSGISAGNKFNLYKDISAGGHNLHGDSFIDGHNLQGCGSAGARLSVLRGRISNFEGAAQLYIDNLVRLGCDMNGMSVWLDCGHGAASGIAGEVFSLLGARVTSINDTPLGGKINDGCGALYIDKLRNLMAGSCGFTNNAAASLGSVADKIIAADLGIAAKGGLTSASGEISATKSTDEIIVAAKNVGELGFAFDGDADRMAAVVGGDVLCGDSVLYSLSRVLPLCGGVVVGTVMSNMALERRFLGEGVRFLRTDVGDKNIAEELIRGGFSLGGEQSGHYIFHPQRVTGDGILAAIYMAKAHLLGRAERLALVPQRTVSVPVSEPAFAGIMRDSRLVSAIKDAKSRLLRVLVRMSGTEPKLRIMVEDEDEALAASVLSGLVSVVTEISVAECN